MARNSQLAHSYVATAPPDHSGALNAQYAPDVGDLHFEHVALRYLAALSLRTLSRDTQAVHRYQLRRFVAWCHEHHLQLVTEVRDAHVVDYLIERRNIGHKPNTLACAANVVRSFFAWATDHGIVKRPPRFELPPTELTPVRTISADDVSKIIRAAADGSAAGFRDVALLEFMYATGARASEVCSLNIDDINAVGRTATVLGKGRRRRLLIVTDRALDAIRDYIGNYRYAVDVPHHARALFTNRNGRRLLRNTLYRIIRQRCDAVGVSGVHPHIFRHSLATTLLRNGASIRHVQEILGHVNIQTTTRYTHVEVADLHASLRSFHPRS